MMMSKGCINYICLIFRVHWSGDRYSEKDVVTHCWYVGLWRTNSKLTLQHYEQYSKVKSETNALFKGGFIINYHGCNEENVWSGAGEKKGPHLFLTSPDSILSWSCTTETLPSYWSRQSMKDFHYFLYDTKLTF